MLDTAHTWLSQTMPTLFHQYHLFVCAFIVALCAPLVAKIILTYPQKLEQSYREEAQNILSEPAPKFPTTETKWLLPTITLTMALCLFHPLTQSQDWLHVLGALWMSIYITTQFFSSFYCNLPLEELNKLCLWVGLALSIFTTYIPATEAILGATLLYSVLWLIEHCPLTFIQKFSALCSPGLAAMFGAWLGWSTGAMTLLIGLALTLVLQIIQASFIRLIPTLFSVHHLPLLPTISGPMVMLWLTLFVL